MNQNTRIYTDGLQNKPLWSFNAVIEAPDIVKDVHRGFIELGCEMITTNTYHASIPLMDKQYDTKKQEDLISVIKNLSNNFTTIELTLDSVQKFV